MWWSQLFKKEDWRLVKTFSLEITRRVTPKESGKFYYHLYESDRKNRRVEFACTFADFTEKNNENAGKAFDIYQEKILRWEKGRVDPEIPRYDQIPEEETANILKGKIS